MAEDVEQIEGATEEPTGFEDSQTEETLAPESAEQETSAQTEEAFDLDAEQEIVIGDKRFNLKGTDLISTLENLQSLADKEKNLNRDYTQKMQQIGETRKSFESAFGRMPEAGEIQALGKIWNAYFSNPKAAEVIDALIAGNLDQLGKTQPSEGSDNPEVAGLKQEINMLKNQLTQFTSSSEQREQQRLQQEGERIFNAWKSSKESQGQVISEDKIDAILEMAGFLRQKNPSWDTNKALDEALRRETIDLTESNATKKVIKKAEEAKKTGSIKITPKAPTKPTASMSYSEIIQSAM